MIVRRVEHHGQDVHILTDDRGRPVEEVARYMKLLNERGCSPNTLKTYCTGLKFFYEFLEIHRLGYRDVKLKSLVNFVVWLRNPYSESYRIIPIDGSGVRSSKTTNLYITAVVEFYRFLASDGLVPSELVSSFEVSRFSRMAPMGSAGFLAHAGRAPAMTVHNVLKAKVPRRRPPTISPEQASALVASTTNFRDRFIVTLLLESGLRVGEMLGLFIEDFRFDKQTGGCYVDVVFRGYHPNGGSAKTRDRSVPITQDLMEMFDDYIFDIREEVGRDHPFVMVKIAGSGAGEPLDYGSVRSAFRRYSERVGAHVTPHMLRHTYGTLLYAETKDLRLVQELLGHSSMKTTSELYVHPTSEDVYEGWSKAKQRLAVGTMANVRTAASDG